MNPGILLGIGIAVLIMIAVLACVVTVKKQRRQPVLHAQARVVSVRPEDIIIPVGDVMVPVEEYHAEFVTKDRERLQFAIDAQEYSWLREGDQGELKYQGKRFVSFVRE